MTVQGLSPLDAAFLHAESARTPMHLASVAVFEAGPLQDDDGNLRIDDLRRLISRRLDLVPKLRRRPRPGLLGEAPPRWDDDPGFDIANHVVERRVSAPGSERQLLALCGEVLSSSSPGWPVTGSR
jgi:hypothetical protein